MSLKLNGIGKPITTFTYAIKCSSQGTVFVSIIYQRPNRRGVVSSEPRIYELFTDATYTQLDYIVQDVTKAFSTGNNHILKITVDPPRGYVHFKFYLGQYYTFSGKCVL